MPHIMRHPSNSKASILRNSYESSTNCSFLPFPTDDNRREKWNTFIGEDFIWKKSSRICEVHFDENEWITPGVKLKPECVPTLKCKICPNRNKHQKIIEPQEKRNEVFQAVGDHSYYKEKWEAVIPEWEKENHNEHSYGRTCDNNSRKKVFAVKNPTNIKDHDCISNKRLKITAPREMFSFTEKRKNKEANKENENPIDVRNQKKIGLMNEKIRNLKKELAASKRKANKLEKDERLQWVEKAFSQEQVKGAITGNTRGRKWGKEDIKKGLRLKYSCGKTGYEQIRKEIVPLPSVRSLQEATESVKMEPGILTEVLSAFQPFVENATLLLGSLFQTKMERNSLI